MVNIRLKPQSQGILQNMDFAPSPSALNSTKELNPDFSQLSNDLSSQGVGQRNQFSFNKT